MNLYFKDENCETKNFLGFGVLHTIRETVDIFFNIATTFTSVTYIVGELEL